MLTPSKLRSGFRKLTLDSGVWQYRIGKVAVVIFAPDGTRYVPDHSDLTGLDWNSIERLHWKNSGSGHHANIRPSTIRKWIEENCK